MADGFSLWRGRVRRAGMREIMREVADRYDMAVEEIKGSYRFAYLTPARTEFALRAKWAGFSSTQIGEFMGGRDHTSILHYWRREEEFIATLGLAA